MNPTLLVGPKAITVDRQNNFPRHEKHFHIWRRAQGFLLPGYSLKPYRRFTRVCNIAAVSPWSLHLCPTAKQIVVDTCQLHADWVARRLLRQSLNRRVKLVEKSAVAVSANHALDPKE